MVGIREDENCRCSFPDHGTEAGFIVTGVRKLLDTDIALIGFAPKLSHALIGSFCTEQCDIGCLWRRLQEEIKLLAVEIRSQVDRDTRDVARSSRKARYDS